MLKLRVYSDIHQEFKLDSPFVIQPYGNEKEQAVLTNLIKPDHERIK